MHALALIFSPSGRLARKPFAVGAAAVYGLMILSQVLLVQPIATRAGVIPFAAAQALLTWAWFALHAKRLREAGHPTGSALGIAILYAISTLLFLMLLQVLFGAHTGATADDQPGGLMPFVIVLFLIAMLTGEPHVAFFFYVVLVIVVIMLTPFLVAIAYSVWTGTRPPAPAEAPAPVPPPGGAPA
jgi:uncharacterized membrane protein YhaH (DUF805 family)